VRRHRSREHDEHFHLDFNGHLCRHHDHSGTLPKPQHYGSTFIGSQWHQHRYRHRADHVNDHPNHHPARAG
jgi:hypothetical protein